MVAKGCNTVEAGSGCALLACDSTSGAEETPPESSSWVSGSVSSCFAFLGLE